MKLALRLKPMIGLWIACCAAAVTGACKGNAPSNGVGPSASQTAAPDTAGICDRHRAAVLESKKEPGTPSLETDRPMLVGSVRGAAVLWKRPPRWSDGDDEIKKKLRTLETSKRPMPEVRAIVGRFRGDPKALRTAVLREGYLFADNMELALALVNQVGLTDLFNEPVIHLHRRGVTYELRWMPRDRTNPARYVHTDGPLRGEMAELLFADRVGLDAEALTRDRLVADLRPAMETEGFDRIRGMHWAGDRIAAEIRYGEEHWVPALFDVGGALPKLECVSIPADRAPAVEGARAKAKQTARVLERIRQVVSEQVREQLPFDVARSGSEDGDRFPLRPRWESAYLASMKSFEYGDERYEVYDSEGKPRPPQVCLEFVFDTWERAAGTHWAPMTRAAPDSPLEPRPSRIDGKLRVSDLGLKRPRFVPYFLQFVLGHPERFDVWTVPEAERVQFTDKRAFFALLERNVDRIREGDVLFFRRGWSEGRSVYHSVIVIETDPCTGMPSLVAGNAARPRLQTLQGIMQITWKRYLEHRVRARPEWLDEAVLSYLDGR